MDAFVQKLYNLYDIATIDQDADLLWICPTHFVGEKSNFKNLVSNPFVHLDLNNYFSHNLYKILSNIPFGFYTANLFYVYNQGKINEISNK